MHKDYFFVAFIPCPFLCTMRIAKTFIWAYNKSVETKDGCHIYKLHHKMRHCLKTVSRLLQQTAHFFLPLNLSNAWITIQAIDTIQNSSWSVMYIHPQSRKLPARAIYTPPFRSRGMTRQPSYYRTPSTKGGPMAIQKSERLVSTWCIIA